MPPPTPAADTPAPDSGFIGRAAPVWDARRTLRIALLGDFSGRAAAGRLEDGALLAARKPLPVEFHTLDDAIARLSPDIRLPASGAGAPALVRIRELDDFHPDALAGRPDLWPAPPGADALRAVLHQRDFQNLESLWRGVDFLLHRLDTGPTVQVHLFDVGMEEFAADLGGADDLADSALYQWLAARPAEEAGGGYRYTAACWRFDATPAHAALLGRAARVAAHAGAPFITALAADTLADRREPPPEPVQRAFAALRGIPEAGFIGLMAPRFLLRRPYGKKSDPVASLPFEEFTSASGLRGMLWGHPALLALSVLARPGASLTVGDLPFHYFVDRDGDTTALPCTERLLDADTALWLRTQGINAVMARKGEPLVRLAGLRAVNGGDLAAPVATAAGGASAPAPQDRGASAAAEDGPGGEDDALQEDAPADLDTLLAELAQPASAASEASADTSREGAADPTQEDDGMDPDLKALLASLN